MRIEASTASASGLATTEADVCVLILHMLDFNITLVRLVDIIMVLLGVLVVNADEFVYDGAGVLKPLGQLNH